LHHSENLLVYVGKAVRDGYIYYGNITEDVKALLEPRWSPI